MGRFFLAAVMTLNLLLPLIAHSLCVKSDRANLRQGPGTNHKKSWEVYRYFPLRKISQRGSWYQTKDFEGDRHWIHKKLVTSKFKCAVIKVNFANLRSGPDTKRPVTGKAEKYQSFRVLKFHGSKWMRVKDEHGQIYWLYRSLAWVN
jgi:SH3-like domain-containing protein